jgi:hypothetical protein
MAPDLRNQPVRLKVVLRGRAMAIYKLTPLDPTDSVWRRFPFVETVWINARDEHEARLGVSATAHRLNPDLINSPNSWPWLYFARCTIDEGRAAMPRGEIVDVRGQRVGAVTDVSEAAVATRPVAPILPRKVKPERGISLLPRAGEGGAKGRMRGRSKRALH